MASTVSVALSSLVSSHSPTSVMVDLISSSRCKKIEAKCLLFLGPDSKITVCWAPG